MSDPDCSLTQCELFGGAENSPAPDSPSGKTSPAHSPATMDEILLSWLVKWLEPGSVYRQMDGKTPELLSAKTGWSNGAAWTRSFSESRNAAGECSLWQILETGEIDPRYYLSPRACAGILRRAEKRGKQLPPALEAALRSPSRPSGNTNQPE